MQQNHTVEHQLSQSGPNRLHSICLFVDGHIKMNGINGAIEMDDGIMLHPIREQGNLSDRRKMRGWGRRVNGEERRKGEKERGVVSRRTSLGVRAV